MTFADTMTALAPTHWYRMGEASGTVMADAVGTLDGTYYGTPLLGQPSLVGDADGSVKVQSSSQYFDTPNDPSPGASRSLSIAVNMPQFTGTATVVDGQWATLDVVTDSAQTKAALQWSVKDTSGTGQYSTSGYVFEWSTDALLTITYDGSTARLYYGATEVDSIVLSGGLYVGTAASYYVYSGFVLTADELSLFDKALSATDVADLAGFVGTPPPPPVESSSEYANFGYNYTGLGLVDYDPPVAPTPARVHRTKVKRVHQSMPAPTLVDGRPT